MIILCGKCRRKYKTWEWLLRHINCKHAGGIQVSAVIVLEPIADRITELHGAPPPLTSSPATAEDERPLNSALGRGSASSALESERCDAGD